MHTSCSTLFLLHSSWEMKKVCLVSTQKKEMGAGLWEKKFQDRECVSHYSGLPSLIQNFLNVGAHKELISS